MRKLFKLPTANELAYLLLLRIAKSLETHLLSIIVYMHLFNKI